MFVPAGFQKQVVQHCLLLLTALGATACISPVPRVDCVFGVRDVCWWQLLLLSGCAALICLEEDCSFSQLAFRKCTLQIFQTVACIFQCGCRKKCATLRPLHFTICQRIKGVQRCFHRLLARLISPSDVLSTHPVTNLFSLENKCLFCLKHVFPLAMKVWVYRYASIADYDPEWDKKFNTVTGGQSIVVKPRGYKRSLQGCEARNIPILISL